MAFGAPPPRLNVAGMSGRRITFADDTRGGSSLNGGLIVWLEKADGLPPMDKNGSCDPKAIISVVDARGEPVQRPVESKIVKDTLSPVWDQSFEVASLTDVGSLTLQIVVEDWDRFTRNDAVGTVSIPLGTHLQNPPYFTEGRFGITPSSEVTDRTSAGAVWVHIEFVPEGQQSVGWEDLRKREQQRQADTQVQKPTSPAQQTDSTVPTRETAPTIKTAVPEAPRSFKENREANVDGAALQGHRALAEARARRARSLEQQQQQQQKQPKPPLQQSPSKARAMQRLARQAEEEEDQKKQELEPLLDAFLKVKVEQDKQKAVEDTLESWTTYSASHVSTRAMAWDMNHRDPSVSGVNRERWAQLYFASRRRGRAELFQLQNTLEELEELDLKLQRIKKLGDIELEPRWTKEYAEDDTELYEHCLEVVRQGVSVRYKNVTRAESKEIHSAVNVEVMPEAGEWWKTQMERVMFERQGATAPKEQDLDADQQRLREEMLEKINFDDEKMLRDITHVARIDDGEDGNASDALSDVRSESGAPESASDEFKVHTVAGQGTAGAATAPAGQAPPRSTLRIPPPPEDDDSSDLSTTTDEDDQEPTDLEDDLSDDSVEKGPPRSVRPVQNTTSTAAHAADTKPNSIAAQPHVDDASSDDSFL